MDKIIYYSVVISFLIILLSTPQAIANTTEEPTQEENSEEVSSEEPTEESTREEYTWEPYEEYTWEPYEEYTEEYYEPSPERTYERTYENYPAETQEPTIESTTEPVYEPTEEPTFEVFTEEMTEEPVEIPTEEPSPEPEPVEEPVDVAINENAIDSFSIEGKVTGDGKALADVTVVLSGEAEEEVRTDAAGEYAFTEVPSGEYEIRIEVPEGYSAGTDEQSVVLEDKGKKGIDFELEKDSENKEDVELDEQVLGDEGTGLPMDLSLIIVGSVLLGAGLLVYLVKRLRR